MLTTREICPEGFTAKNRDWDKRENVEQWRESWADISNRELERKGLEIRIDHRSYQKQGIEREPTIHLGSSAHQLEKRGEVTERGEHNREVSARNLEYERSREAVQSLIKEREQEPERIAERMGGMKDKYFSVDRKISGITEVNAGHYKGIDDIGRRSHTIKDSIKQVDYAQSRMDELQRQRDGLGMFKGREKKELDAQIDLFKYSRDQAINKLQRECGIEPSQAQGELHRLAQQAKEIQQQIDKNKPQLAALQREQQQIAIEYKQKKIRVQFHPDRDKIESLLNSRDDKPRNFDEKIKLAKLESINRNDYERAMEREPDIAPQIAPFMPKERSRSIDHGLELSG